ncbi:hypothetical protein Val02_56300 [Virgisporangium aliadipatigenens]|uniref:HTH tetR-type domain-containing protein n=1 Tax=Virgisporangium aliadipatigenens TaxID=741659 RepID=A0A8J4DSI7_9ACTN|nr:TetR/AcrR family transcriptional regulator [Virgisporangium aliadipatigenens]GIJ48744.1 hypothetical protein Val02_56300 [Virgisporangium aliadipatigenens]
MSHTAERIAVTARALLDAEGSAAVSMRRVAATIGVTPMALYRHYPNRDALLAVLAERAFGDLEKEWRARPSGGGGPEAELFAAFDALFDVAVSRPHLYRFLFTEVRDQARVYPDGFRDGGSPTLNVLTGIVRAGVDAGVLRAADEWEVAFTLAAHMQGLILLYQGGRTEPGEAFRARAHASLKRVLDGLRA